MDTVTAGTRGEFELQRRSAAATQKDPPCMHEEGSRDSGVEEDYLEAAGSTQVAT